MGVTDIPGVFTGEITEEIHVIDSPTARPPGVVVAVMTRVADVATLTAKIHAALPRFAAAGIRILWIYRAFDDPREVLLVQEIESEATARRWIDHPDAVADWMISAGADAYPPLFVGRFVHMARIDADDH